MVKLTDEMKKSILTIILLIMVTLGINAQEFHPYKVKFDTYTHSHVLNPQLRVLPLVTTRYVKT